MLHSGVMLDGQDVKTLVEGATLSLVIAIRPANLWPIEGRGGLDTSEANMDKPFRHHPITIHQS